MAATWLQIAWDKAEDGHSAWIGYKPFPISQAAWRHHLLVDWLSDLTESLFSLHVDSF
jgi:hypothetical protein